MAAKQKGGEAHEITANRPSVEDLILGGFFSVEMIAPDALIPYIHNPKAHPETQIKKIAGSLAEYKFDQPLSLTVTWSLSRGMAGCKRPSPWALRLSLSL